MNNLKKIPAISFGNEILPTFGGFYNSYFEYEIDDIICNEEQETNKEINVNYKKIYGELSVEIYELITRELIKHKLISNPKYIKLESPKYYNFSNDKIIFDFDLLPENILQINKLVYENKEYIKEQLKKYFTSYDGFFSYYSNDFNFWELATNNFTNFENKDIHISSLLEIILNLYVDEYFLTEININEIIYSNIEI